MSAKKRRSRQPRGKKVDKKELTYLVSRGARAKERKRPRSEKTFFEIHRLLEGGGCFSNERLERRFTFVYKHVRVCVCACVRASFRAASMIIVKCTLTTSNTQKLHFHFSFASNFAAFIEPIEIH